MTVKLDKYKIYKFSCCDEGRQIKEDKKNIDDIYVGDNTYHYFIIISPQEYSHSQNNPYVSGIPLSHSALNYTKQTYGLVLDSDDFSGAPPDLRDSIILCDRPMRLYKGNITDNASPYGSITYKALQKIMIKIAENLSIKLQVKQ